MAVLGCQTEVIGGGSGGSGGSGGGAINSGSTTSGVTTSGSNGTGGVGGTAQPNDGPAIAMLYSEIPPVVFDSGSSVASGGPGPDPNTLVIFLSNGPQSCASPNMSWDCGPVGHYQIEIQLPPNLQAVGTYPLQDHATMSETDAGSAPNECSAGGGTYWDGTIQVTAIDSQQVSFTLAGTANLFLTPGTADGAYTAPRCF